jgi:hypothetical protein
MGGDILVECTAKFETVLPIQLMKILDLAHELKIYNTQLYDLLYLSTKKELYELSTYLQNRFGDDTGKYDRYERVTLYGSNVSCMCGCCKQTIVFSNPDSALECCEEFSKNITSKRTAFKMIELHDCEDIKDNRYIYENTVISLGKNDLDINGDKVVKIFNIK